MVKVLSPTAATKNFSARSFLVLSSAGTLQLPNPDPVTSSILAAEMPPEKRNTYFDHVSDESDHDAGYDSEAAEVLKASRASKRRKIEHDSSDDEADEVPSEKATRIHSKFASQEGVDDREDEDKDENPAPATYPRTTEDRAEALNSQSKKKKDKETNT